MNPPAICRFGEEVHIGRNTVINSGYVKIHLTRFFKIDTGPSCEVDGDWRDSG